MVSGRAFQGSVSSESRIHDVNAARRVQRSPFKRATMWHKLITTGSLVHQRQAVQARDIERQSRPLACRQTCQHTLRSSRVCSVGGHLLHLTPGMGGTAASPLKRANRDVRGDGVQKSLYWRIQTVGTNPSILMLSQRQHLQGSQLGCSNASLHQHTFLALEGTNPCEDHRPAGLAARHTSSETHRIRDQPPAPVRIFLPRRRRFS